MRISSFVALALVLGATAALPACGGSGPKFSLGDQNIKIDSTALPLTVSGQAINHVIPLSGNCQGPYVMTVIIGSLPPGMFLDNATRAIRGVALQQGIFHFDIQIDATGCQPFATTHAHFDWTITEGPVAIVLANPAFIPAASYAPPNSVTYPGVDGLATTVYNAYTVMDFTCAGGTGPYVLDLWDDPADPDDGNLPLGISIPPFSTSFEGSPQEVKPGGRTFKMTLRATDSLGATGTKKVQWKIDTPPIVIATLSLLNGKCGTAYGDVIQVAGGVPPFNFEQTGTLGNNNTIVWQSPLAPIVNGGAITVSAATGVSTPAGAGYPAVGGKISAANYPGVGVSGPYTGITPEGLVLQEATGTFSGTPRRLGSFTTHIHVFSTLVPNEFGQHSWQAYTFSFANSEPPISPAPTFGYGSLATWTVEGGTSLLGIAPWSTLPEFEVGVTYNPDGGAAGLSMIAVGGVAKDGFTDAPHLSQRAANPAETAGTYDWTINWDADGVGAPVQTPSPISFNGATGVLTVPNPALLTGRGRTVISFTTTDQQLPTANTHVLLGRAAYSIGPDKVIITESTLSETGTQYTTAFNDAGQTVKVMRPFSSGIAVSSLATPTGTGAGLTTTAANRGDLTIAHPYGTSVTSAGTLMNTASWLSTLLTSVDILRVSVNPTCYTDDFNHLNSTGARPGQHGDPNHQYGYYNPLYDPGSSPIPDQPSITAVDLPKATGVTHNPGIGVYNDGGKLYVWRASGKFGVMIVRTDSSLYLPVVYSTTTYSGFGDSVFVAQGASTNSLLTIAQLTVSPDGRYGAMKLKRSTGAGLAGMSDNPSLTPVVVFSLCGEKNFTANSGNYYVEVTCSASSAATGGLFLYANSMCLTNNHLYFLTGNNGASTNPAYSSWNQHYIWRSDFKSATPAAGLVTGWGALVNGLGNSIASPNTTGAVTNSMQTPFQKYEDPQQTVTQLVGFSYNGTTFFPVYQTSTTTKPDMYMYEGWNCYENGLAPVPFRVSKNGLSCAIVANVDTGSAQSSNVAANMLHHVWVDHFDVSFSSQPQLRKLSTVARHSPGGGGRGYSLSYGPQAYSHWGTYSGPTTHLEISDDSSKVAIVVNRQNTAVVPTGSTSNWYNFREDIVAWTTTSSPKWSASTEVQVTGSDASPFTGVFGGTHLWRFGALVFTKDNGGLVYWAGRNCMTSTLSPSYERQSRFSGTLYSYNFGTGVTTSLLATADGGSDAGISSSWTVANPVNPTAPSGTSLMAHGRIRPFGGFCSRSKDFFYMVGLTALSTSSQSMNQLVGVNINTLGTVNSVNGGPNINGRTNGLGFKVFGQTDRRGFLTGYDYYYTYYILEYRYYAPAGSGGMGYQAMAKNTGVVFNGSQYQANGPTLDSTATSTFYVGNTIAQYWGDYGYYGGQVEGFAADVGGAVQRLNNSVLTGDTNIRSIHFIEPSDDGSAIAFVYDTSGNPRNPGGESLMYQQMAWNFNTGVATLRNPQAITVQSAGRVSDSFAHDSSGLKLYYAFSTSGNESGKILTEMKFNKSITASPDTITTRTFATARRYNVLHSGR